MKSTIKLPDDAKMKGHRRINGDYVEVFYSRSHDFSGTEKEFLLAGLAVDRRESIKNN